MEMAYSNKFAVCVLVDGRIMKELRDGSVGVPFGCEYTLRLFNKHDRRAVAKISIDTENVSEGGFIIPAHGKVEIDRPAHKDAAFRFVELGSDAAWEDGKPTHNENREMGLIEVNFFLERERPKPKYRPNTRRRPGYRSKGITRGFGDQVYGTCSVGGGLDSLPAAEVSNTSAGLEGLADLKDGCTVEGRETGTRFGQEHVDIESHSTLIKMFLQGFRGHDVNVAL